MLVFVILHVAYVWLHLHYLWRDMILGNYRVIWVRVVSPSGQCSAAKGFFASGHQDFPYYTDLNIHVHCQGIGLPRIEQNDKLSNEFWMFCFWGGFCLASQINIFWMFGSTNLKNFDICRYMSGLYGVKCRGYTVC